MIISLWALEQARWRAVLEWNGDHEERDFKYNFTDFITSLSPASLVKGVQIIWLDPLGRSFHLVHIALPHSSMKLG